MHVWLVSASISVPRLPLVYKAPYPSSGRVYYSERTPLNVKRRRLVSLFIALFILQWDDNNKRRKNNGLDLNGSKGDVNILLPASGFAPELSGSQTAPGDWLFVSSRAVLETVVNFEKNGS